jgi:hypothetical protein
MSMTADQLFAAAGTIRLERTYATSPATIWDLWTTVEGIVSWWGRTASASTCTGDHRPAAVDRGTHGLQMIEPMHDPECSSRMVAGRSNELDNLVAVLNPGGDVSEREERFRVEKH